MKVAVIGGTGYGAVELIRFLNNHPYAEVEAIISHSKSGNSIASSYPHLTEIVEEPLEELDITKLSQSVELVFFATPSGISTKLVPDFLKHGIKCIDLSGDFRLKSPKVYEDWYQLESPEQKYLDAAAYGLSEFYSSNVKGAELVANPGCFPTATLIGLLPAVKQNLVNYHSVIIDAKTGVSGAGRGLSLNTHFSETNENLKAYKIGEHKHIPEIEQILSEAAAETVQVTFTTHLVPMTRGIMSTIYVDMKEKKSTEEMVAAYTEFYQNDPFVRVRQAGEIPATREVYGSNYCDIGIHADSRTGKLTIVSVIDNLVKGASGQAIQNMNLLYGWDAMTGLNHIPIYP